MDIRKLPLPGSTRHPTEGDAVAIAECLSELGYPSSPAEVRDRLKRLAGSVTDTVFVAVDDEEDAVVGVISVHLVPLFHADGHLARITSLIVKEEYRSRGYGRALIEAAEGFAWAAGCGRIEVTSGDHRLGAHLFYQRLGFHSDSRRFVKIRDES